MTPVEPGDDGKPSRRVDYHTATRIVKALPVASAFEADWAYLQLARQLVPHAAKSLTDRWRGWFVHIDPGAPFPRFVKTSTPGKGPTGLNGIYFGPINDKHAAARFMDALVAGFDLCRYYHVLIEAPQGKACAYKEMGRCPAPCDGSVSMAHYHQQVVDAIEFASDRHAWQAMMARRMSDESASLQFESAERCRRQINDVEPAMKPAFEFIDRLERFQWLAVTPGERNGWARITLICGGWIAPFLDVPLDISADQLHDVAVAIKAYMKANPVRMEDADIENIGLVCMHFFRKRKTSQPPMVFEQVADGCDASQLADALQSIQRKLKRKRSGAEIESQVDDEGNSDVSEQAIDAI